MADGLAILDLSDFAFSGERFDLQAERVGEGRRLLAQRIVDLLNGLLEMDPNAVEALCRRVRCNQALADHPAVQVKESHVSGVYFVGLLGVLNGLVGVDEQGRGIVAAEVDVKTRKYLRFYVIEDRELVAEVLR